MKSRPKEIIHKQQVWEYYGLGIPRFVPVFKRGVIEKCNDAICLLLDNNEEICKHYQKDQSGKYTWIELLEICVSDNLISKEEYEITFKIAKNNNHLPKKFLEKNLKSLSSVDNAE